MRKIRFFLAMNWRAALIALAALLVLGVLFFYRLESLTPGYSDVEQPTIMHLMQRDIGIKKILSAPTFLPYQLGIYGLEKLNISGIFAARAISASLAIVVVAAFYYIVQKWYSVRIALLTTALLACSSWLLHSVRLATPTVSFLMVVPLIAVALWLHASHERPNWVLLLILAGCSLLLYVPGMVWFILAGLLWQGKHLARYIQGVSLLRISLVVVGCLVLLSPAALALAGEPTLLKQLLGFPEQWPAITEIGSNIVYTLSHIVLFGPNDPVRWIGAMPYLDVFTGVMLIIGIYAVIRFERKLDRSRLLLFMFIMGLLLVGLGGAVDAIILMPIIYLVVAAGLHHYLQQWLSVFPRNPFARTLGIALLCLAILASLTFHLRHYFIAWPYAPETRQTFSHQL